jgi:hypothetical protein
MVIASERARVLAVKFQALLPHLDERQRRLAAGAEAIALGRGGVRVVAKAAGMREGTVSRGVTELKSGQQLLGRARRPGGGRKRSADVDPSLRPALLELMEPADWGTPRPPLLWTTRSLRALAAELTRRGHLISAGTVADLLRRDGFQLLGNLRVPGGCQDSDRDAQFSFISSQVEACHRAAEPVVFITAAKQEPAESACGGGRENGDLAQAFAYPKSCTSSPAGGNGQSKADWIDVRTDHITAALAVDSLRRWWQDQTAYPEAQRILIIAAGMDGNGPAKPVWEAEIASYAMQHRLVAAVCHFPPGTARWSMIEHQSSSQVITSWRGRPAASHKVVVSVVASHRAHGGNACNVDLRPGNSLAYAANRAEPSGVVTPPTLTRHSWRGDWNYIVP